jgi:hypothetical protein
MSYLTTGLKHLFAGVKPRAELRKPLVRPIAWPKTTRQLEPIGLENEANLLITKWTNKVTPTWQRNTSFPLTFTARLLPESLQKGLLHRLNLYQHSKDLMENLRNHCAVDEELLLVFDSLYQQVKQSTKILRKSITDPTWGLAEKDGLVTEEGARRYLMHETMIIICGLEREMRIIIARGLQMQVNTVFGGWNS